MMNFIAMFFNRREYKSKTLEYLLIRENYIGRSHGVEIEDSLVCRSFETTKELNEWVEENLSKNDQKHLSIYARVRKSDEATSLQKEVSHDN